VASGRGELRVGDGTGTAGRSPATWAVLRGCCNGRKFGLIVAADEDVEMMEEEPPVTAGMEEVGEGIDVAGDAEESSNSRGWECILASSI
jgi:hypothetical protein